MKNVLLTICLLAGFVASSQRGVDSLWGIWNNKVERDTVRMQALYEICRDYYAYSKPDTSLLLSDKLYEMALQRNMRLFAGKVLNAKLASYVTKGDYPKALAIGRKALVLFRNIKYYKGVSSMAENIGVIYQKQGDYHRALSLFFKGLRLKEHLGDSLGMPTPMVNIATIYANLGRPDSALRYQELALAITERYGPRPRLFLIVMNQGNLYQRIHRMDKAFACYQRALSMAGEFGNHIHVASLYNHLLGYYREKGDYAKAMEYYAKAMAIHKSVNSRVGMAQSLHMLSTLYYFMEKLEKARVIGEEAIALLGSDAEPALLRDMISDLGNVYYNQKNFKKALSLHLRFIALRDSIRNDSLTNASLAGQYRAEAERKEMKLRSDADKLLMAARSEAERRDQQKNIWILVVISLLVILGLIGYFSYRHWRQKNIIADQKNKLLSEKLLISQMNPHFIFNSLNAIQNFIFKQDHYLAGIYLKQFSELMRMILEFSRREYISLEEECRFMVSYLDLQKLRFGGKFDYSIVIDEHLDRDSVLIPPMLGQPFAENAIEHGIFHLESKGVLSIRIRPEGEVLVYEVEDNGVGLAAAKLWKRPHHKSLATDITRERLASLHRENSEKGELEIIDKNSRPGMGSGVIVKFTIP